MGRHKSLSPEQIEAVRRGYRANGKHPNLKDLAKVFDVTQATISNTIKGVRAYKQKENSHGKNRK